MGVVDSLREQFFGQGNGSVLDMIHAKREKEQMEQEAREEALSELNRNDLRRYLAAERAEERRKNYRRPKRKRK